MAWSNAGTRVNPALAPTPPEISSWCCAETKALPHPAGRWATTCHVAGDAFVDLGYVPQCSARSMFGAVRCAAPPTG